MNDLMNSTLASRTIDAIINAPDADAAMTAAVGILAREVPTYNWVGIYLLVGNELVLGPFVGARSPHTRIPLGRGICGAAATEQDDHRGRCEERPAVSRMQPRDPVGDRGPDHPRRRGAR